MSAASVVHQLTKGGETIVDAADAHLLAGRRWFAQRIGQHHSYAATGSSGRGGKRLFLHQAIACPPAGYVVDHINGNGLDNRRQNLRVCTRSENLRNRRKSANSTQPYKGIARDGKRWIVRIRLDGKRMTVGTFDTAEEAASAYDFAAVLRFGEFACLNFPHVFPEVSQREA